jgi:trigger factor
VTLKIQTEEDDKRQLKMTVEVNEARVEKEMRKAARRLARDIHVPGFRPGRAPYRVILRRVGRDSLRAEVAEELVQPVLEEAVEQVEAELSAPPQLDDIDMEPLVFSFTVPLAPKVELGSYRDMRKEIEPVAISDEAIDEALEQIRVRHQVIEEVDRPAQAGDLVTVAGAGSYAPSDDEDVTDQESLDSEELGDNEVLEQAPADDGATDEAQLPPGDEETGSAAGEESELVDSPEDDEVELPSHGTIFDEESIDLLLDDEKLFAGTPFVENLLGLSSGDETNFSFQFPDDFEDDSLAGKLGTFDITVLNVKSRELPELDDDLAEMEGGHESLEELRQATSDRLKEQAEAQAKNDLIEGMIDDLLPQATFVYPPALVENEIDGMVESFKRQITQSGWEWDDFMRLQGDSTDSVRDGFRERAEESLRRRFALRQFILEESLTVDEEDVEAAIDERVKDMGDNEEFKASMADFYRSGSGLDMISSDILMDKAHARIEAILSGNAPDLSDEADGLSDEEE